MDYMKNIKDLQTKVFINSKGSIENVGIEFKKRYPNFKAFVVFDINTKKVAGDKVIDLLKKSDIEVLSFLLIGDSEENICPYFTKVKDLKKNSPNGNFIPVSVGSGTINDLVKRFSYEIHVPYLCIPTAPSVDGYSSFGAALIVDDFKVTVPCSAPEMIIADSNIMKTAPIEMISAGYGDLYAKNTAGTDWIIADKMRIESINKKVWDIFHSNLKVWLKNPQKINTANNEVLSGIFAGLCASGFAMQIYGSSRPASGLEHNLSHVWEMEYEKDGLRISHGFKVSVGILISTAITESFLKYPIEKLNIKKIIANRESWETRKNKINRVFSTNMISKKAQETSAAKWIDDKELEKRLNLLKEKWPEIRSIVQNNTIPFEKVKSDLKEAGCPTSMKEIGLSNDIIRESVIKAQMIRNRYILIEAVYDCGLMSDILDIVETYF